MTSLSSGESSVPSLATGESSVPSLATGESSVPSLESSSVAANKTLSIYDGSTSLSSRKKSRILKVLMDNPSKITTKKMTVEDWLKSTGYTT